MPAQYKRGFAFILILVILLVIGSAAAVGWYFVNKSSSQTTTSTATESAKNSINCDHSEFFNWELNYQVSVPCGFIVRDLPNTDEADFSSKSLESGSLSLQFHKSKSYSEALEFRKQQLIEPVKEENVKINGMQGVKYTGKTYVEDEVSKFPEFVYVLDNKDAPVVFVIINVAEPPQELEQIIQSFRPAY